MDSKPSELEELLEAHKQAKKHFSEKTLAVYVALAKLEDNIQLLEQAALNRFIKGSSL